MEIINVIKLATEGELRNLSIKDDNESILGFINLGMIELYKRFPLKTDEYIFNRVGNTSIYTMPSDLLRIVDAWGYIVDSGKVKLSKLGINENDNPYSINTISWSQIQVNSGIVEGQVSIIYNAAPAMYGLGDIFNEIDLPPQMIEPLLHYVGYRAFGAVDSNIQGDFITHYQRFEAACDKIKMEGMLTSDDVSMAARIYDRGFV